MAVDVWQIYYVTRCQYTKPEPKPKLVRVACVDARAMGCLINTKIDKWIQIDPDKLVTQATILAAEHKCLDVVVDEVDQVRGPVRPLSGSAAQSRQRKGLGMTGL